jgi:hypothetical protein
MELRGILNNAVSEILQRQIMRLVNNSKRHGRKRSWPNVMHDPVVFLDIMRIIKKMSVKINSEHVEIRTIHLPYAWSIFRFHRTLCALLSTLHIIDTTCYRYWTRYWISDFKWFDPLTKYSVCYVFLHLLWTWRSVVDRRTMLWARWSLVHFLIRSLDLFQLT